VHYILTGLLLMSGPAGVAFADVLMLKDGQAITGTFRWGDQTSVNFEVNGQMRKYQLSEVNSVTFTNTNAPAAAATTAAPTYGTGHSTTPSTIPSASSATSTTRPAPAPASSTTATTARASTATPAHVPKQTVTIPAGTEVVVRMIDAVDSSVHEMGQTFRASLDEPLVVNGQTIASRGAMATAKLTDAEESGKITGRSELTLVLLDMYIYGRKYDITTASVSEAGSSRGAQTAKMVGGLAAVGAVIGAIAGGGSGAAKGAAAGAGAGAAVQVLTGGEKVQIPAESRLVFALQNSLTM